MKVTRRQFSLGSFAAAVLAPLGLWKAKPTVSVPLPRLIPKSGTFIFCYHVDRRGNVTTHLPPGSGSGIYIAHPGSPHRSADRRA